MPIGLSVCFSRNPRIARVIFMAAPHRGLQRQVYDLVPKGRDEDSLQFTMAWVRHHDRYGDRGFVAPTGRWVADGAQP